MDEATRRLIKKYKRKWFFLQAISCLPIIAFIIAVIALVYYGQGSITLCWYSDTECLESIGWEE